MNAALCVAQENHGSRQLGAEAAAAADVHLSVPPIRALPLLRRSRPHDSVRLPVRRGDIRHCFHWESTTRCPVALNFACVAVSIRPPKDSSLPENHLALKLELAREQNIITSHLGYSS